MEVLGGEEEVAADARRRYGVEDRPQSGGRLRTEDGRQFEGGDEGLKTGKEVAAAAAAAGAAAAWAAAAWAAAAWAAAAWAAVA